MPSALRTRTRPTPAARGYSTSALDQPLGLILLAVSIVAVVGLAAFITFVVIRIFPTERTPKKPEKPETPSGDGTRGAGRLFRKAKRGTA